jgi:2-desacetyl-2-hydroxyethyl bacteriochlorophyllide A dehydrogenase
MKAVVFDGTTLSLQDKPVPVSSQDTTLIKVSMAGICNTDLEITKGYILGFNGIPGHEFFGTVVDSTLTGLNNKRVTAEINCGCGKCHVCAQGDERHCANRTVIGISGRDGAFAEYISVPNRNVVTIPDEISDENALFIEPLAAALAILEQIEISPKNKVLIIGDGKLGQLIAHVIAATSCELYVAGKHTDNLEYLQALPLKTILTKDLDTSYQFDIVIEASGSPEGFFCAVAHVKPRGTIVLKSTYAHPFTFNPAPLVVNEITLIGSRCGRFGPAIRFLIEKRPDFSYLIEKHYSIDDALKAFSHAAVKGSMKIVIDM